MSICKSPQHHRMECNCGAQMSDNERMRRFRKMSREIASYVDYSPCEPIERAGTRTICDVCGLEYVEHPEYNGLHFVCRGRWYKL